MGSILNFVDLGKNTGISHHSIRSYFQILEDTLIGNFLLPFGKSKRNRLTKHPKFYFFDCGVVRAIAKKSRVPLVAKTVEFGFAFEQFVINEVMRWNSYRQADCEFSFFRTEHETEVDLIIETPEGRLLAIECKGSDRIQSKHLTGLRLFASEFKQARLAVASLETKPRRVDGIDVVPWQRVLAWIEAQSVFKA